MTTSEPNEYDLTPEEQWRAFALKLREYDIIREYGGDLGPRPEPPSCPKPHMSPYRGDPTWVQVHEWMTMTDALIADRLSSVDSQITT